MKYLKIQQDIMKSADARDQRDKEFPWMYGTYNGYICFSEGHFMIFVPEKYCYLNVECFGKKAPFNVKKFLEIAGEQNSVTDTQTEKIAGNTTCRIFKNPSNNEEIWIDKKLLSYFELKECTFQGTNKKSPIFIYEGENLCGLVLPVNHP